MSTLNDSLTLILDGKVTLADLAEAVGDFRTLVDELSKEVGAGSVEWVVTGLEAGSATATVSGAGLEPDVERVVLAYERVGESLYSQSPFPYTARVRDPAMRLMRKIGPRIEAIRLETPRTEWLVTRAPKKAPPLLADAGPLLLQRPGRAAGVRETYGMVDGQVETLSHRQGLRFVLYDRVFDRSVSCYLAPGYEEIMREAWGRRAQVFGRVRRDPLTGRPLSIRDVNRVERVEEGERGSWRLARGAAPSLTDLSPEAAIRALRDG